MIQTNIKNLQKIIKIINSCTKIEHISCCRKMIKNHKDEKWFNIIIDNCQDKIEKENKHKYKNK
jgi:hypothetical protein